MRMPVTGVTGVITAANLQVKHGGLKCEAGTGGGISVYTDNVMEHVVNPRNVGRIDDADAVGTVGDPGCGDWMRVYLRVKDDRIADIKFEVQGCGAAIASGSVMTELAAGKTLDEAWEIMDDTILEALGGLPAGKIHCSNLGAGALHKAIMNYVITSVERQRRSRQTS